MRACVRRIPLAAHKATAGQHHYTTCEKQPRHDQAAADAAPSAGGSVSSPRQHSLRGCAAHDGRNGAPLRGHQLGQMQQLLILLPRPLCRHNLRNHCGSSNSSAGASRCAPNRDSCHIGKRCSPSGATDQYTNQHPAAQTLKQHPTAAAEQQQQQSFASSPVSRAHPSS